MAIAISGPANAEPCDEVPPDVAKYLTAHRDWAITKARDLNTDDQAAWAEARPGKCPGFAAAKLDRSGKSTYGLVLIRGSGGSSRQRVVFLSTGLSTRAVVVMASAYHGVPMVIFKADPGRAVAWDQSYGVRLRHESLVVEQMEAWAQQYYLNGRRLRYITTSN